MTRLSELGGGVVRRFGGGEFVYLTGEAAGTVYVVRTGLVKTSLRSGRGDELILRVCRPGDLFGELGFCAADRRDQARAVEASEVLELSTTQVLSHLERDQEALGEWLRSAAGSLRAAYERLHSIAFDGTMERLARVLLALADDFGQRAAAGVVLTHYIKQEDLAHMIGARREVVSGLLNRLRERGMVEYSRRGAITVKSVALRSYLEAQGTAGRR